LNGAARATRGRLLVVNWQDLEHPLAGGAEVHLQENLRRLAAAGFDVTLLCSRFAGAPAESKWEGVRILRHGGRFEFNWRVPFLVRSLARRESFDLVIEDINKIPFYTPVFQSLPVLAIVPHMFATTVFHEINPVLATYIYLMEYPVRWLYRSVPFCVISESTRQDLVERGFQADRVAVIHCGIDHERYRFDPSVARFEAPTVLYLGRLKKYKNVQQLIAAFARLRGRLPEARLIIVGDGDYRPALEKQAAELGLGESVQFTGFVAAERKIEFLRRAHVAVCPSMKEGWGLTNIEANACGTPAIAADAPGLRDSVRHDETGRLYPFGDIARLEADLLDVLTDAPLWVRYHAGALRWAARFDWDRAAEALAQLVDARIAAARSLRRGVHAP
jgi:glycosyltransferase involved in cell wall biosynthesis